MNEDTETLTEAEREALHAAQNDIFSGLVAAVEAIVSARVEAARADDAARLAKAEHERDQAVAVADSMQHFADVAEVCERKSNDYAARLAAVEALLDQRRDDLIYPTTNSTTERTMLISVAAVRAALGSPGGGQGRGEQEGKG